MKKHILTKLFLVTNMHLYINPKREFLKILNFEQARPFCSKQAVQKQWSLAGDWAGFVGLLDEMIACSNFKLRLLAFVLEAVPRLPNGLLASIQLWSF